MNLGVVGSRGFNDYDLMKKELDKINKISKIGLIISGGANGADKLAEKYAVENGIKTIIFLPEWDKYPGKSAGPIRNRKIVENSDMVIAFWDGISKGTLSSINIAKELDTKLEVVQYT